MVPEYTNRTFKEINRHDGVYRALLQYSMNRKEQNDMRHSKCTYYKEEYVHDAVHRARIRYYDKNSQEKHAGCNCSVRISCFMRFVLTLSIRR